MRFSQRELAERAGIRRETVSRLERSLNRPQGSTARAIAVVLGCDPSELFSPEGAEQ